MTLSKAKNHPLTTFRRSRNRPLRARVRTRSSTEACCSHREIRGDWPRWSPWDLRFRGTRLSGAGAPSTLMFVDLGAIAQSCIMREGQVLGAA